MNYTKFLTVTILLAGFTSSSFAQDQNDALRYSFLSPMGTARSIGFGNALGSVGGDFTSLSVNPAGIGQYRRSEVEVTPSLRMNSVDGSYLGTTTSDNNTRFNFNSAGVVFTSAPHGKRYERSNWKAVSFGIGVNRLADFNRDYTYSGNMNKGSAGTSFSEIYEVDANNNPNNVSDAATPSGAASSIGLIAFDSSVNSYRSVVPYSAGINQKAIVSERGGINEVVLSLGGNYQEKLLLGATVGIPIINYTFDEQFTEIPLTNTPNFTNFTYSEQLNTHGTGINLKLGFIYKVNDYFRFGAAVHTPTYYTMHDDDQITISNSGNVAQPYGSVYNYNLTTPWRTVVSATGFVGKAGFVTADWEMVGYGSAKYTFDANNKDYQSYANHQIDSLYKTASIIRLGAEVRLSKLIYLRAGYGYYMSPFQNSAVDANRQDVSGGIGFRVGRSFLDFAYIHTMYNSSLQPYQLGYTNVADPPPATLANSLNAAVLTFGIKM